MLCDPSFNHRADFFMLDELATLDCGPTFFDEGQKTSFLLCRMLDCPGGEPGSAPALRAGDPVY